MFMLLGDSILLTENNSSNKSLVKVPDRLLQSDG